MKRVGLILILFFLCTEITNAQKYTINGTVKDSISGERLAYANIMIKGTNKGSISDNNGNFLLKTDSSTITLQCSYVGYNTKQVVIQAKANKKIILFLSPASLEAEGVTIIDTRDNRNVEENQMGKFDIPVRSIKKIPSIFGEADVLKSIQLLPGIQSSGEGNSGFYVRGGSIDQNLILLDKGNIYNAGHLFGFFSVFNADAIKSVEIMKGDIPANYGGRLSSVLNITSPIGDMQHYKGNLGIGLIFSNIHLEGPIIREKASFLIAARRTYVDALIQPFLRPGSSLKGLKFYFYDVNGKMSWQVNPKNQLHLNIYRGNDTYGFRSSEGALDAQFSWSNFSSIIQWWHFFNAKQNMHAQLNISDYVFDTKMGMEIYKLYVTSSIQDYSLLWEMEEQRIKNHEIRYGADYTFHRFHPNHYDAESGSMPMELQDREKLFAHETATYFSDKIKFNDHFKVNLGLRASYFQQAGPHNAYLLNEVGQVIDTIYYKKLEKVKDYWGLEPRISLLYAFDSTKSIKAAYNHNYQYVQQVTLSCISLPTDAWIPSTADVAPQQCDQFAIGWFQNFMDNKLTASFEAYYKKMKNLTEYREGFSPFTEAAYGFTNSYTQGDGWSYGFEWFLQKNNGRLNGWLSYTLSWSFRQFEEINNGNVYCAKNDRRHDVSLMVSYDILPNLTTSATWVYATGNTMTVPIGYYFVGYNLVVEYSETNAYRMAPYHRMDLSVQWVFRRSNKWEQSLNFSVYNVYNRKNPFFINIYTTLQGNNLNKMSLQSTAYQMSLFPILPSISWNIRFK